MKFCTKCGAQLADEHLFCPVCGKKVGGDGNDTQQPYQQNQQNQQYPPYQQYPQYPPNYGRSADAPNGGFAVLCFFFPIVGLILYLVWHDQYPLRAKSCGKGALTCVIVVAALYILMLMIAIFSITMSAIFGQYSAVIPIR